MEQPILGGKDKWDSVFLFSGRPVPAMLDMARYAQMNGLRTLVIILDRGVNDVLIDQALVKFEVITIPVDYTTVSLRRLLSFPAVYWQINRIVRDGLARDGVIFSASYDLLAIARLLCVGRKFRLRHQVRDLHRLQLGRSAKSRVLAALEKLMLRRAEMLIVSAPGFFEHYYVRFFSKRVVLLENTPARSTWLGFRKEPREGRPFRIGFVGIVRYKQSLRQLIEAVERLAGEGMAIDIMFAGGGLPEDLELLRSAPSIVRFCGPYEYTRDIKRLYSTVDLIYSVYDNADQNCQIAMPNKFYEAIIAKIPIVVASRTYVAAEVQRLGIGTAVESGDVEGLISLLRRVATVGDWYDRAVVQLDATSAEYFFSAYERALADSIMPIAHEDSCGGKKA
ncbi:MAG: glycosyltransferase [Verrucomicrobia bacterium]|nr:glycosyltransferase [Verrucomicrobiota bacterium]